MKRLFLAVAACLLVVCAGGLAAQTFVFDIFAAYTDRRLPALDRACPGGFVSSSAPIVYDKTLIVFFTCGDGSVTARRYFNVHDLGKEGQVPIPVFVVPNPNPNPPAGTCSTVQPGPDWTCRDGGWLPPGR
jgi:hypothetical protein